MKSMTCPLCRPADETVIFEDGRVRVILVDDPHYPGFLRVIWQTHCAEMTDLSEADRSYLMSVVFAAESVVRRYACPDKVNLASFGNQVSHVHWHVIPRWHDDAHFPESIWGKRQRTSEVTRLFSAPPAQWGGALREALERYRALVATGADSR